MALDLPDERKAEIFVAGLRSALESVLRRRLEETVQEVLDDVIQTALNQMQASVEMAHDPYNQQTIIKVLLEDRREDA